MTSFDDRRAGFEAAFRHDQEQAFRVASRRNRLFGLWAAERLGLAGRDAESYAGTVVVADLEAPGDDDVIGKVRNDFAAKQIVLDDLALRAALTHAAIEARSQLAKG